MLMANVVLGRRHGDGHLRRARDARLFGTMGSLTLIAALFCASCCSRPCSANSMSGRVSYQLPKALRLRRNDE